MTRTQITSALSAAGFTTGQWISLGDSYKYILFESDKNSFNDDAAVQYYFSPTGDYVLIRHLMGKPVETTIGATVPAGYVKVLHDGTPYLIQIEPYGKIDASVDAAGVFHGIYSFHSIVGLFNR